MQPRPPETCEALGICEKHGMPSSHAQVMAYAACMYLLVCWRRSRRGRTRPPPAAARRARMVLGALEAAALIIVTGTVCVARVYLGYHSAPQVVAGAALGAAAAAGCFCAMGALAPAVLRWLRWFEAVGLVFQETLFVGVIKAE
jgi:dolichyldiphosphatase